MGDRVPSAEASARFVSPLTAGQCLAADMNDIVHTVAGCSRPYLSEHTVLTIETCGDLPRIRGNPDRLTDVLYALMFRAERSTASSARNSSMIRIRTMATHGEVRLSLSDDGWDTGLGDSAAPDLLLGLTECAEIISDHGGSMVSWRPYAGGAIYTIILPAL